MQSAISSANFPLPADICNLLSFLYYLSAGPIRHQSYNLFIL